MDQSTYNNGQLNATASPVQAPGEIQVPQSNFGDMSALLKKALEDQMRRKQIEQNRAAQMAAMPQPVAINRPYGNPVPNAPGGGGMSTERPYDQLRDQARGNEAERMMLDRLPAPTRMVHGAGIISGQTMDPMAMNAAQRKNFLPNTSQMGQDQTAGYQIGPAGSTNPGWMQQNRAEEEHRRQMQLQQRR